MNTIQRIKGTAQGLYTLLFVLLFVLTSCSDGMHIGQEMETIIEDNAIETVTINTVTAGEAESVKVALKDISFQNQFLKIDDKYINLGGVRSLTVNGKDLEVELQ